MQLRNALGYKCYSTMDIRMGFNNIWVKKEDIYKTAFKCIYGIFMQKVMGFGYKDAPTEFQETMEKIFEPIIFQNWISIYMDDILLKTNSKEEMIQKLQQVFKLMKLGKIKADPSKCEFLKKEVKILGKLVSEKGIRISDSYIEIIQKWIWPEGLESFNGKVTWMSDFVPHAQKHMAKIREVILGKRSIKDKEAIQSFEDLKKEIRKKIILAKPDYNKTMMIFSDAGPTALGGMLCQKENDKNPKSKKVIIGFFSRSLNDAQKGYTIPEKELMAINETIDHFYSEFRLATERQVYTDSRIAYLLHKQISKENYTKSQRILELLVKHMYLEKEIIHIKRENNQWADFMTRIGQKRKNEFLKEQEEKLFKKRKLEPELIKNEKLFSE